MEHRPVYDEMAGLLLGNRWAALGLAPAPGPAISMVAYAVEPGVGGILLFLSGLASHTTILREEGRAALAVSAPDLGAGDPQELPRLALEGPVDAIPRDSAGFTESWPVYAARFPSALPRLALADFILFRLSPASGRYVGGFATAEDVRPELLAAAVDARQSG
ncbi:MAG: pyridoxamine 5'-phosphate oxidase [Acidimicrobiia bacterium]|nr:pyridoxamine 5'-phosphate oxidase [Acidimicrobiia bacterium]